MTGLFATDRRRCLSPASVPGAWQAPPRATEAAMREAASIVTGKHDIDPEQVSGIWQGLKGQGWGIETEERME